MPTVPAGTARYAGGCLRPVLLRGRTDYIDGGTGELLHRYTSVHEPGGVLPIACKTRRASRCLPCAETYRADTYQLIRAGLTGGKGVPATVADHPCVFLTLTAPPFGAVHSRREKDAERAAYQREAAIAAGLLPDLDDDTTLVINHWHFAGRVHPPPIDPLAAASASHASCPPTGGPP